MHHSPSSQNWPVDYRMGDFVPSELQHNVTPFRRPYAPVSPHSSVQQLGLFLVGVCLLVTGFSVVTVTTQVAEVWVNEVEQEINARITPSRWNF